MNSFIPFWKQESIPKTVMTKFWDNFTFNFGRISYWCPLCLGHLIYNKEKSCFVSHLVKQSNIENRGGQWDPCQTRWLCLQETLNYGSRRVTCNLFKRNLNLFATDRKKLTIVGRILLPVKIFTKRRDSSVASMTDLLYFVEGLKETFISKDALTNLVSIS